MLVRRVGRPLRGGYTGCGGVFGRVGRDEEGSESRLGGEGGVGEGVELEEIMGLQIRHLEFLLYLLTLVEFMVVIFLASFAVHTGNRSWRYSLIFLFRYLSHQNQLIPRMSVFIILIPPHIISRRWRTDTYSYYNGQDTHIPN